jgi:hypothetical protein
MAKKKRKIRQPNLPQEVLERAQAQATGARPAKPSAQPAAPKPATVESEAAAPQQAPVAVDLAAEYGYVAADLQRIGLLSALMLIALVVLRVITA